MLFEGNINLSTCPPKGTISGKSDGTPPEACLATGSDLVLLWDEESPNRELKLGQLLLLNAAAWKLFVLLSDDKDTVKANA
jgi:hypothetical protein